MEHDNERMELLAKRVEMKQATKAEHEEFIRLYHQLVEQFENAS